MEMGDEANGGRICVGDDVQGGGVSVHRAHGGVRVGSGYGFTWDGGRGEGGGDVRVCGRMTHGPELEVGKLMRAWT